MDRIWDASKYPLKPLMTLCQNKVQGHEAKKVKIEILGLGGVMQAAKSDFRQERKKMTPEYFLKGSNETKFEKRKKCQNHCK